MANDITYDVLLDQQFQRPYVDVNEWRDVPIRHRYIHGGFEDTQTRFCFYYPPNEVYVQRFFHFISPFVGDEKEAQYQEGEENKISMAVSHGSYLVESNLGGIVNGGSDPTLMYRASAASAQFSRKLAVQFYGEHRPYGYIFGGSGGGYKTISCVENTTNIWDGAVPFVIGSPVSLPNVMTVRAHAMRVLRHKMDAIKDALEPGGSHDPYACLNEEEKAALREAELMGFPMKTWCVYDTIGAGSLTLLAPAVYTIDPTYTKDYWNISGYLGSESGSSAQKDRIVMESSIESIYPSEKDVMRIVDTIDEKNAYGVDEAWKHALNKGQKLQAFRLSQFPQGDFYSLGMTLRFIDGHLAGERFDVIWLGENAVIVDGGMDSRDLSELMSRVSVGDKVIIDNSDYIAIQTYHRHQVPAPEYHAWDQFRDKNGDPIYPQRLVQTGPIITLGGAGSVQNGTPNCKMIILESLMDESALPWQADWYRDEIQRKMGIDPEDIMRLWYMENCMHTDCDENNGGDHQHVVSYLGALCQALLDLSDWVERGITPASSSAYDIDNGKVLIKANAAERKGIQPIVSLTVNGGERAEIKVGDTIQLSAWVQLPEGSGAIEEITWDFMSTNKFQPGGTLMITDDGKYEIKNTYCYDQPGTYFPVIKVATNRNSGDIFTRIRNLARVRVVVSD